MKNHYWFKLNFKLKKAGLLTNKLLILLIDEEKGIFMFLNVADEWKKESINFGHMASFSKLK
jgi:hypothetical protein